jgi:hypothetical protein
MLKKLHFECKQKMHKEKLASLFFAMIIVVFPPKTATCFKFFDCLTLLLNAFAIFKKKQLLSVFLNCILQKDFDCNDAECVPKLLVLQKSFDGKCRLRVLLSSSVVTDCTEAKTSAELEKKKILYKKSCTSFIVRMTLSS